MIPSPKQKHENYARNNDEYGNSNQKWCSINFSIYIVTSGVKKRIEPHFMRDIGVQQWIIRTIKDLKNNLKTVKCLLED